MLVNGLVLGIKDVVDGTAKSAIDELEKVLIKIREVATELKLPNASHIGWRMFKSAMSDSASTQKCFNKLLQQKIDEENDSSNDDSEEGNTTMPILQLFCGMHLGVNLREAQVSGVKENVPSDSIGIDKIVHTMCKLLRHLGSHPEYGMGVRAFPEFLQTLIEEANGIDDEDEEMEEIKAALGMKLQRQVGSCYFVTARNAGRLFYLKKFIEKFLEQLKLTKTLNKLESSVLSHINTPYELALLKLDGLFYDKVYADMMVLLKSKSLKKSFMCMNAHYLELLNYLKLLSEKPRLILDPDMQVFSSEPRIYDDPKLDHRKGKNYIKVRERLYGSDSFDEVLFEMVKHAACAMANKLSEYKSDQLPGGKYWEPSAEVKRILQSLPATNDATESILGLNDWLFKRNPNFHQRTVSTLVEVMKNSTMTWFCRQEKDTCDRIISLAKKRRTAVVESDKKELEEQRKLRMQVRQKEIEKGQRKKEKAKKENERIQAIVPVKSVVELNEKLLQIQCSTHKKTEKAELDFLRDQIQHRTMKKVPLTIKGKKCTVSDLKEELMQLLEQDMICNNSTEMSRYDNKRIRHKLECEDESGVEEWYDGLVVGISDSSITIVYDGYDEEITWTHKQIHEDIVNGDFMPL